LVTHTDKCGHAIKAHDFRVLAKFTKNQSMTKKIIIIIKNKKVNPVPHESVR
jgi:hypothetical protein